MARILAVDDEKCILDVFRTLLQMHAYDFDVTADGAEALNILNSDRLPDLVITDLRMLPIDGLQIVQAARNRAKPIPVIVITAYDSPDTRKRVLELGATHFVTKPFSIGKIMSLIRETLAENPHPPVQPLR